MSYDHIVDKKEIKNEDDPQNIQTKDRYLVFSYVSPETKDQSSNIAAIKIRGCFPTHEEANEHVKKIMLFDNQFDVWIMEMWKWCPFPPTNDTDAPMHYAHQSEKLDALMSHVNNEKSGRNKQFIERMESVTNTATLPLLD